MTPNAEQVLNALPTRQAHKPRELLDQFDLRDRTGLCSHDVDDAVEELDIAGLIKTDDEGWIWRPSI